MADYEYHTVDVFTDKRFGGNPLAVFPAASGLDTATMQALAAELNYSETTFVLPPRDPANTAQVRIFNRSAEMPFAGHPNVGTAFVLARLGLAQGPILRFEEIAGLVEVRLIENGAEIAAPQPLSLLGELDPAAIAACLSLPMDNVILTDHAPIRATTGIDFVFAALTPDALSRATPDANAYRRVLSAQTEHRDRLSIFAYARAGAGIRARMFSPLTGTWEDPATGSANATLAALLLSLSDADDLAYDAVQGVEMGRESHLALRAWRSSDGIRARVAGRCVSIFRGAISL